MTENKTYTLAELNVMANEQLDALAAPILGLRLTGQKDNARFWEGGALRFAAHPLSTRPLMSPPIRLWHPCVDRNQSGALLMEMQRRGARFNLYCAADSVVELNINARAETIAGIVAYFASRVSSAGE